MYDLQKAIEERSNSLKQLLAAYERPKSEQNDEDEETAAATVRGVPGAVGEKKKPLASPLTKRINTKVLSQNQLQKEDLLLRECRGLDVEKEILLTHQMSLFKLNSWLRTFLFILF